MVTKKKRGALLNRQMFCGYISGLCGGGGKSCGASALRRRPGLTGRHHTKDFLCPGEERGNVASQGGVRRRVAAVRLQCIIATAELSRAEGGLG